MPGGIDMSHDEMLARISVDPAVCFGKPCIRGTRIWVSLILENLAGGLSEAELLKAYPQIEVADIRAALAFGAEAARERVVELAPLA
jgi:uncharacterized protein (DUF433 family)